MDLLKPYIECSNNIIQPYSWLWIMRNHELIVWLRWVNENICQKLDSDIYKSTDVKVRIATGMLNKIESLDDIDKIRIHYNFVNNIKKLSIDVALSKLPF